MSNTWVDDFYQLNPDAITPETLEKKKNARTLSLSAELSAMDFSDLNFYKNLSEEHKKEISIWVLMRYMSSSQGNSEHHLLVVNDLVNRNFNSLKKHPELQWKLLALCGTNKKQYHPWIAPPKRAKKNKVEEAILKNFPLLRESEIDLLLKINSRSDLENFFKDNGYDDKTIKELFKDGKAK